MELGAATLERMMPFRRSILVLYDVSRRVSDMMRNVRDVSAFISVMVYAVSLASFFKIVRSAEADASRR